MNKSIIDVVDDTRPFSAERPQDAQRHFSPNSLHTLIFSNKFSVKRSNRSSSIARRNLASEGMRYRSLKGNQKRTITNLNSTQPSIAEFNSPQAFMPRRVMQKRRKKSENLRLILSPSVRAGSQNKRKSSIVSEETTREDNLMNEKLNPKIVERWISNTLEDAKYLDIPGIISNPTYKEALTRHSIDRVRYIHHKLLNSLSKHGLGKHSVERLYKGLFVYSIGFNELVKNITKKSSNHFLIQRSIWKVYSILLEFCCKSDYTTLIGQVTQEYLENEQKMKEEFEIKHMESQTFAREIKTRYEELIKSHTKLAQDLKSEKESFKDLEKDFEEKMKIHEEEVSIRLKFENKLNDLHSLHKLLQNLKSKRKSARLHQSKSCSCERADQSKGRFVAIKEKLNTALENKIKSLEVQIEEANIEQITENYTKKLEELDELTLIAKNANIAEREANMKLETAEAHSRKVMDQRRKLELDYMNVSKEMQELNANIETKLQSIKVLERENTNFKIKASQDEIIKKEQEERIDKLYQIIEDNKEKITTMTKSNELLHEELKLAKSQLENMKEEKTNLEEKLELLEKDRLEIKDHSEQLKIFELELYNKVVDKESQLSVANREIDKLTSLISSFEKSQQKLIRKLENSSKSLQSQVKQHSDQVASLNTIIEDQGIQIKLLHSKLDGKQEYMITLQAENSQSQVKISDLMHKIESLEMSSSSLKSTIKTQSTDLTELTSKMKRIKTKCQNQERTITHLTQYKEKVEEVTNAQIQALNDEITHLRNYGDKEKDRVYMTYEDIRSQAYEYKVMCTNQREEIRQISEQVILLTNDKILDTEKITNLKKEVGKLKLDLENIKSENLHLDIKVKDNSDMIEFLKKNLELKSMGLEEYYQKYVAVYMEHYHLKNKHTVLSNRFAQYELIIKTSKSMLEALRNRKNAKVQTDFVKNHDIAIMTNLVWKDISRSGIIPSVSSNRSELSLYPNYKAEENKQKMFKSAMSYNKDLDHEANKLIKFDDSDGQFQLPIVSQKTLGTGEIFGDSKVKFSMMESQLSSIKKVVSRYDSKNSSESADELGVDLFETINQIEQGYTKENSSHKNKKKKRSKSIDIKKTQNNRIGVRAEQILKTSPSLPDYQVQKRKPLMRKKMQKKSTQKPSEKNTVVTKPLGSTKKKLVLHPMGTKSLIRDGSSTQNPITSVPREPSKPMTTKHLKTIQNLPQGDNPLETVNPPKIIKKRTQKLNMKSMIRSAYSRKR
ncbi:unnamed protein product [Moneuplotes crassus]|uniref:Uncharacterized protein n=1 Tax=Euplotes crassus TaxID=5936 RepID=A0AAD1XAG6_EUPCR|nr:unnamed protein product [Moneuplotes crassus]